VVGGASGTGLTTSAPLSNFLTTPGFAFFWVGQYPASTSIGLPLFLADVNDHRLLAAELGYNSIYIYNQNSSGVNVGILNRSVSCNVPLVFSVHYSSNSGILTHRINGSNFNITSFAPYTFAATMPFQILVSSGGFVMSEFVCFNTDVTTEASNVVNMEGFLAVKYGISASLSNGHPYKSATSGPAGTSIVTNASV
jgi:hypothetical protein